MAKYKIVHVTWEDAHCAKGQAGWCDIEDADGPDATDPFIVDTVGILIRKDKDCVILSMGIGQSPDGSVSVCELGRIPAGMVRKLRVLGTLELKR